MGFLDWFNGAGSSSTPMELEIRDYYAALAEKDAGDSYIGSVSYGDDGGYVRRDQLRPSTNTTYAETNADLYGTFNMEEGGFIAPSTVFRASDEVNAEDEFTVAWNELLIDAGLPELSAKYGLAQNWWPGLDLRMQRQQMGRMWDINAGPGDEAPFVGQEGWEVGALHEFGDPDTGAYEAFQVRYDTTHSSQMFAAMGTNNRGIYTDMLVGAGLLDKGYRGLTDFTAESASAFTEASRWANYYGTTVKEFLENQKDLFGRQGGGRGSGSGARRYTIEVPDYETLLSKSESMLQQQLGRDPKDWEMSLIADEFQKQYGHWASAQKRKALGGNGVYEVPDPEALTAEYMEDKYANEISRVEDVGERSSNNRLILQAATTGSRMMGAPTPRELPQQ